MKEIRLSGTDVEVSVLCKNIAKKKMKITLMALITLTAAILLSGCGRGKENETQSGKKTDTPSTISTAIDGFTGKTAVEHGKKANAALREAEAIRNSQLDEVMEQ